MKIFQFMRLFFVTFLCFLNVVVAGNRSSSFPYISGDTFREFCDFTYDELNSSLNPSQVKEGNTIFIKTDNLGDFFNHVHPHINAHYIIVSHNGDMPVPREFAPFLNEPKIIAWFGQNVENYSHPKLHPIPIGLANQCWPHGNIEIMNGMVQLVPKIGKNTLLYMNFSVETYFAERNRIYNLFRNESYCQVSSPKNFRDYLQETAQSKFILSPRGNGLDCHRTWESLLMGAYPIVRTSTLDSMYENLPVVIIKDWSEINQEFLQKKYASMQVTKYQSEKMYAAYWLNLINMCRENYLKNSR